MQVMLLVFKVVYLAVLKDAVRIWGGYQMRMEPGSDEISNDSAVVWMQFFQ